MAEHPSIRSRAENVVFVRFARRVAAAQRTAGGGPHLPLLRPLVRRGWSRRSGRCLADCGARSTTPESRCGEWRRPPLLTVV